LSVCIYCIDNDIIKKLATFQLFDRTIQLFDCDYNRVNILRTAKYKFQKDWRKFKDGKSRKSEDKIIDYEQVLTLTQNLHSIAQDDIDQNLFTELNSVENIDAGEAILVTRAMEILQKDEDAQIFTGDKKFIKALAKVELPIIDQLLHHRLWCLEQLILKNIEIYAFETVRDLIVSVRECDTAIKVVFGSGDKSTQAHSISSLKSYINKLRQDAGNLLYPYPES
jgi:hypothetical protein